MKKRLISGLVLLLLTLVLAAVLYFGMRYIGKMAGLSSSGGTETSVAGGSEAYVSAQSNGPLELRILSQQVGGQEYLSFEVYFLRTGTQELLYTSSRMFPAAEVEDISWADNNDILVTLKNGKESIFSYDGVTQWN